MLCSYAACPIDLQAEPLASNPRASLARVGLSGVPLTCASAASLRIQKADAIRLYREDASAGDVARKLLGTVCEMRTGRHEEDGCWPTVRAP